MNDDLTFVHSSGYIHDKPKHLAFLSDKIKTHKNVRAQPLAYIFLPELVITTGQFEQSLQRRNDGSEVNIRALVTQVWIRRETGWKLPHLHSGRLPDGAHWVHAFAPGISAYAPFGSPSMKVRSKPESGHSADDCDSPFMADPRPPWF